MVLRRNVLPNVPLEAWGYRRPISLGIFDHVNKHKDEKKLEEQEDDMRLQRLGFDEKYFNNRT